MILRSCALLEVQLHHEVVLEMLDAATLGLWFGGQAIV